MALVIIRLHSGLILLIGNMESLFGLNLIEVLFRERATIAFSMSVSSRPMDLGSVADGRLKCFALSVGFLEWLESGEMVRVFDVVEVTIVTSGTAS